MLTPQDITEKGFIKAVFGGYDMASVDEFLETVSSDYTALYKENAILKGKLKVLVEKVEEYRSTEDAMRMALLTAQRMGEEITVEAARTKEEMLRNADIEVRAKLNDIAKRIASEEIRLAAASKETAKFLELSHAIMRKHAEFLSKLETANRAVTPAVASDTIRAVPNPAPQIAAAAPAPTQIAAPAQVNTPTQVAATAPAPKAVTPPVAEAAVDDIATEIGNAVERIAAESSSVSRKTPEQIGSAEVAPAALVSDNAEAISLSAEEIAPESTPRPKFDFDDLKFGANFGDDE